MIDGIDHSGALMTATDLLTLRLDHKSTELVRGRLIRGHGPDLVAEFLSPDDRPGEVLAKVGEWLDAGVRLV